MTHSEPRHLGRTTRLHGLLALMLAASIATLAIAAAVALLDNAIDPPGGSPAALDGENAFSIRDAEHPPATGGKRR